MRRRLLRPDLRACLRLAAIGLPISGEFGALFIVSSVIYVVLTRFGASAQAGFSVGSRIMTSIFLPAMAIAFAVSPIVGQNVGAGRQDRVLATFRAAAIIGSAVMLSLTLLCQWRAAALIHLFTRDAAVSAGAAQYLHVQSWNFVGVGLVFVASGLFQGLGRTLPSFLSSASRLVTLVLPLLLLRDVRGFEVVTIWYLSVASILVQAAISLAFAWRALRARASAPRVLASAA